MYLHNCSRIAEDQVVPKEVVLGPLAGGARAQSRLQSYLSGRSTVCHGVAQLPDDGETTSPVLVL